MILRSELQDDPLGRGYADMSDAEALASLTTDDRSVFRDVPISSIAGMIEMLGVVPALRAVDDASPVHPVADQLMRFVAGQSPMVAVQYSDPDIRQRVDAGVHGLADAGVITTDQAAQIVALGQRTVSRAKELGLNRVTELSVKEARE